ncbi:exopolysaccharide biosynthesis protein [Peteryoungia desertarenae]|nr:exopolysaccharide biosynthesis protein [Peteryoungia desertarenae]
MDTEETIKPRPGMTASLRLEALVKQAKLQGSMTIDQLLSAMGRTSIAFTILILSLPALTPIPGPFGMVFGSCLAIVSFQIMFGNRRIWLPSILGRRHLSAKVIEIFVRYTAPLVRKLEYILQPRRMKPLTGRIGHALSGIPVFILAVAVALPIPFGNFLPVAALVLIALGLMERDGLALLAGMLVGIIAISVSGGLVAGAVAALGWAISP